MTESEAELMDFDYPDWWEEDEDIYIHITDEELKNFDWSDDGE